MQSLHKRSAKGIFIHDAVGWIHLIHTAILSNTLDRFRLPIGSHGGVHPLSQERLPCPLHDERKEPICAVLEAAAQSLDVVEPG
jgi:hypothetical protein